MILFPVQTADETYLRGGPGSPGYTRASPRSPGPATPGAQEARSQGAARTPGGQEAKGQGPHCSGPPGSRAAKRKSSAGLGAAASGAASTATSPASNPKNTRCKRPKVVHSN